MADDALFEPPREPSHGRRSADPSFDAVVFDSGRRTATAPRPVASPTSPSGARYRDRPSAPGFPERLSPPGSRDRPSPPRFRDRASLPGSRDRRRSRLTLPPWRPVGGAVLAVVLVLGAVVFGLHRLQAKNAASADMSQVASGGTSSAAGGPSPIGASPRAGGVPTPAVSATQIGSAGTSLAEAATGRTGHAGKVKLGVFLGTSSAQVGSFGRWLGRDPDYVVDFSTRKTWQQIAEPTYMLKQWHGTGYRMVYSVPLLPDSQPASMKAGARGAYDAYFTRLAKNLVASGQGDSILRLGWEFNLGRSRYSTADPAVFISYWRHVVTAMRKAPGQRLKFDWNPNVGDVTYDATQYYPGNDYVDYVGVDVYDVSWEPDTYPYPPNCPNACRVLRQSEVWDRLVNGVGGLNSWSAFARSKHKPMSLPEWGMWGRSDGHGGGNDPFFVTQMFKFIDDPNNNVAYQAYLNADSADGKHELSTLKIGGKTYRQLFAKH